MIEEPKHFAELCRQVGFVVLQAQLVEHNLALYIATSMRLEQKEAVDIVQKALDSSNRKTIERLLQDVQKRFPIGPGLAKRIWDVKEERNWLVHRLQREAPSAVFSEEAAEPVFKRIQVLAREILAALQQLDGVGDRLVDTHGFDSSAIQAKAMDTIKEKTANRVAGD